MIRSHVRCWTTILTSLWLLLLSVQCGAVDRSQVAATPPPTHTTLEQEGRPSTTTPLPATSIYTSRPIAVVGEGAAGSSGSDVVLIDADETKTATSLTNHPWSDVSPTWSPDGSRLAFLSDRSGDFRGDMDIYVMQADGSDPVQITQSGATRPVWSPAGDYIAFSHRVEERKYVTIVRPDGTDQTNVLTTTEVLLLPYHPSYVWSPNGTRLAVSTFDQGIPMHTQIINLQGEVQADIQRFAGSSWTPDGRLVGRGTEGVAIVNADGSNLTYLGETPFRADYPLVSPDGTRLAFIRGGVSVADMDGTNQKQVGNLGVRQDSLVWSPDGTQLAYIADFTIDRELVITNADGSGERRLIECNEPAWQPIPPASSETQSLYLPLIQAAVAGKG